MGEKESQYISFLIYGRKGKSIYILSDILEQRNLIDKKGMGNVVVTFPYNFLLSKLSTENVSK